MSTNTTSSKILFTIVFKLSGPIFQMPTQFLTRMAPPSHSVRKRYGKPFFTFFLSSTNRCKPFFLLVKSETLWHGMVHLNVTLTTFLSRSTSLDRASPACRWWCLLFVLAETKYIQEFTIDDVFKVVIMATLKSSDTRALRDAYDQLLDDLDENKDLTFTHIQTVCARQFRRRKDKDRYAPSSQTVFGTPRGPPRTSPPKPAKYNKYKHQDANPHVAMLCSTLEDNGVRPEKVLRKTVLAGAEWLLQLSPPSSRPLTLTSRTRSLATVTQTKTMVLNLTTTANSFFCSWEAYRVYFLFSLFFLFSLCFLWFLMWRARPSIPLFAT